MANELATTNDVPVFNIAAGAICTVDINTIEGKKAVVNAINGAEALKTCCDTPLQVIDVVTTPGVRSISGTECSNTYLILKDGRALFSQSDGVDRSIRLICALFTNAAGVVDFGPDGQWMKCIEQKLNNGNTLKTIVMCDPE